MDNALKVENGILPILPRGADKMNDINSNGNIDQRRHRPQPTK